jgi:hypothetical protein
VNSFYVAGVRFNPVQNLPELNDRVLIRSGEWRGRSCYEIHTENGERIGYVPRRYISQIPAIQDRAWRICAVKPDAVPWQRYRISVPS